VAPGYQVAVCGRDSGAEANRNSPTIGRRFDQRESQARPEDIISEFGSAGTLFALARSMLYDPRWPWHGGGRTIGATVDARPHLTGRAPPHGHGGVCSEKKKRIMEPDGRPARLTGDQQTGELSGGGVYPRGQNCPAKASDFQKPIDSNLRLSLAL